MKWYVRAFSWMRFDPFIHVFYALLFVCQMEHYYILAARERLVAPELPIPFFFWLPLEAYHPYMTAVLWAWPVIMLAVTVRPQYRALRILALIGLLSIVGYLSSFGKTLNDDFGWVFALLAMVFLPKDLNDRHKVRQVVFVAMFSSVICYGMSGIWKIRKMPLMYAEEGMDGIIGNLGNSIAYEHFKYAWVPGPLAQYFLDNDTFTGLMFLGLVALQALAPILVMFERAHLGLGLLFLLFHVLSELILRIPFRGHMFLMVLFFIYPSVVAYLKSKPDRVRGPPT